MRSLSILFTNNTLAERGGSELWVRDVARALVAHRHRPIAFSLVTGAVAAELRAATVPVVTDLANVSSPPDLIHGHHHIETLIAALTFPGVPIVHVCHGWLPWEERPLKHPAVVRYIAVDETCAERLTLEEGIPAERVELLLNFVDCERFTPRPPLPDRPARALVFSNQASDAGYTAVVRQACHEAGIRLRVAGHMCGHVFEHPERELGGFDLVFAKGRCALEALAVGSSVIVADAAGAGPLVTTDDYAYLRSRNFGIRLLQQPHTVDWYRRQIAAYNRDDAAAVSMRLRQQAGLDTAVDRLLDLYDRVIGEHASAPALAEFAVSAQRAAAAHLATIAAAFKQAHASARRVTELEHELAAAREHSRYLLHQQESQAAGITERLARRAARWLRPPPRLP